MVRLSDFIFDTSHPPRVIEKPLTKQLARLNIPGKNGAVLHDMGSNNMRISLQGSLYNTTGDTDKRRTDMESLMTLAMANNPMTFVHDVDHPCGVNGDAWSEYANTTAMDADWTAAGGCTRAVESSIIKVGSKGLLLTMDTNAGTMTLDNISDYNLNHPEYSALCFWIKTTSAVATDDDITIKCYTTDTSNYYYQILDASTDFKANVWYEIVLPVGSGASTDTAGVDGWTSSGSPDWTNIDGIQLSMGASVSRNIRIDGFCLTHAVLFEGFPQYVNPTGRPDQYNYTINLVQYIQ